MDQKIFTNSDDLCDWLEECSFFEDGYFADFTPLPLLQGTTKEFPSEISFQAGWIFKGSYRAGDETVVCRFLIVARNISEWSFRGGSLNRYTLESHCTEGIEVDENADNFDIAIDHNIILKCGTIAVTPQSNYVYINKPFVGTHDANLSVIGVSLPTPAQVQGWFAEAGLEICFRRLGDVSVPASEVPENHEGWFIQEKDRLNETTYGLMIKYVKIKDECLKLGFAAWSYEADVSHRLWHGLARVAANFANCTVSCGNCQLTGAEWLSAVEQGQEFLDSIDFAARLKRD